jgi:hypothetical protein
MIAVSFHAAEMDVTRSHDNNGFIAQALTSFR